MKRKNTDALLLFFLFYPTFLKEEGLFARLHKLLLRLYVVEEKEGMRMKMKKKKKKKKKRERERR